jgi:hypothetical protein
MGPLLMLVLVAVIGPMTAMIAARRRARLRRRLECAYAAYDPS